jgi:hypothetical protein
VLGFLLCIWIEGFNMETTPTTPVTRTRKVRNQLQAEPKQRAKPAAKVVKTTKAAEPAAAITPKPQRKRAVTVQGAVKDTVPKAVPAKAKRTSKPTATSVDTVIVPIAGDALNGMISIAAYYLAERRGFAPGAELQDWLIAEQQIHSQLQC